MDFAQLIQTVSLYAIPVLLAITLHEAAHGYAAKHLATTPPMPWGASRSTRCRTSTRWAPS